MFQTTAQLSSNRFRLLGFAAIPRNSPMWVTLFVSSMPGKRTPKSQTFLRLTKPSAQYGKWRLAARLFDMPDNLTVEQRSRTMSSIRARGNKQTELTLAKLFRKTGITGWRRHVNLPGTPDFSFSNNRVVVFVDGCFWHRCPRCYKRPQSNRGYWDLKIARNHRRDREVNVALRQLGWRVIRIWECALRKHPNRCVVRVRRFVSPSGEPLRS